MHASRTFGRLQLEIDKMGGLQFRSREAGMPLVSKLGASGPVANVQLWDDDRVPEVHATLIGDATEIWNGTVFSRENIAALFRPFQSDGKTPTVFARRPGGLGRSRTVQVIRLETKNAREFDFTVCSAGEVPQQTLCSIPRHEIVEAALEVSGAVWRCVLLDAQRDKKKLERFSK